MHRSVCQCSAVLLALASIATAQSVTGVISGRVLDPTGQSIPGAEVKITRQSTAESRVFTTDAQGEFIFPSVQPGTYNVSIKAGGFRPYEKTALVLTSSERLNAGNITLTLGQVSDAITVEAET